MNRRWKMCIGIAMVIEVTIARCPAQDVASLPQGVQAVWDLGKAWRQTTLTRQRISINGLWRWQPADPKSDRVPGGNWGYIKVPGCWPGITDYLQKDFQTVHAHPSWQDGNLASITAAWHQREIAIPASWSGRRITIYAEYVNSFAVVYLDGRRAGEIRFPAGEVDITSLCRLGTTHVLSMFVVAMPLKGVMLSYNDSNSAREVKGSVRRRGLCGDVYLVAAPAGPRIANVKVDTSVRNRQITFQAELEGLTADVLYSLRAEVSENGRAVRQFAGKPFRASDLENGHATITEEWLPDRLWDTHTPENTFEYTLSLIDAGKVVDTTWPERFGFREFWIDGRDFYLNGTRIFLSAVPLDNAQVGAALATYEGAKESLRRLQSFGINFVYTHNYGCEPGSHLSFAEILRAADDVGMLVSFSQPHFSQYDWKAPDADQANGYARHAEFYVRAAQNHPSVVMYSMSHNATGYSEDMNPDLIDGIYDRRDEWSLNNARRALRAEAIVKRLDGSRVVYHHSSGNLGSMHTSNFYPNFVPIQEMSDWFEHWATQGVKPFFTCEYGAPFTWDWAMYRGWYQERREFGSAVVPWDFCLAEWNAQFLGDAAFWISDQQRRNLRWEADRFRSGRPWHRWDYPHQLGSDEFDERYPVLARYLIDNWRAFRTWGVSAISPWEHHVFWKLRLGMDRNRRTELKTDWENLQRPGFSPDYLETRYERMDLAYERSDWVATPAAEAMLRNNGPLLAYLAGKPARFTSKDHNFLSGETVEKQVIVINNSRLPVTCDCTWSLALPEPVRGEEQVRIDTGEQARIPLTVALPRDLPPGSYELSLAARFSSGQTQADRFAIHVVPPAALPELPAKIALFDLKGQTRQLLAEIGVRCQTVDAGADLSRYDLLIIGKAALTTDGPAPDIRQVRDGLKVVVFEQTPEALERRFGFRVAEYGLRNVFARVSDHPVLASLDNEHLRDWRGESTILPPRLEYQPSDKYNGAPVVRWCGLEVPRLWRCGNRGNVASVLIEKPARGDFLPIIDGGFSLQYSPLLEYREGCGMVLFCQMDVTARTEDDPAAGRLLKNLLAYVSSWKPAPRRKAFYAGEPGGRTHLESAGVSVESYTGGALSADQVLVVGSGGGKSLARHAAEIGRWLKAGGHLLALALDAGEANNLLPAPVKTTSEEHIAAWFEPPSAGSLLAGIGPADVHNRDPRKLPLVSGGAQIVGNGVLAQADGANVVFCQLVPYHVSKAQGTAPSLSVTAEEAAEGKQAALVTMGTAPWAQFGQKVQAGEVGKTYTFAVLVKAVGEPVHTHLEVELAGSPWDRAARGEDVQVGSDEWTELHVTFQADKPYPEGWSAYIHCAEEGGRMRADRFRLYQGDYALEPVASAVAAAPAATSSPNLFSNPGFEAGTEPWFFSWPLQQENLRRTYRRASFLLSRLLANMGVAGETPLLSRFSTPVNGTAKPSVLENGDFRLSTDGGAMPDYWQFSAGSKQAVCAVEEVAPGSGQRCIRITGPGDSEGEKGNAMLAQHHVPMENGQWYRISLKANSEGMRGGRVSLTVTDTSNWRSCFDYQSFAPGESWKEFAFMVQSRVTTSRTRFQIWHGNAGTLRLSEIRMSPCDPPSQGRWTSGLYLDAPQMWDDPYRYFRW